MANAVLPTRMDLAVSIGAFAAVAVVALTISGRVRPNHLKRSHGWALIGAFLIAAPLTHSDAAPQMGFAVAIWVLYELGVLVAMVALKLKRR